MPEMTDRLPGEIIFASFSNQLIRRSAQRYADRTARDAQNPVPEIGDLAYITTLGILELFNGALWVVMADEPDITALSARLDVWENKVSTAFFDVPKSYAVTTWTEVTSLTLPSAGDYLITTVGVADWDFPTGNESSTGARGVQVRWLLDGDTFDTLLFISTPMGTTAPKASAANLSYKLPLAGMAAGAVISWEIRSSNSNTSNREVQDYYMMAEQWPGGILPVLP